MLPIEKEYNEIINEHVNTAGTDTIRYLAALDEAGQGQLLTSLTGKLYDKIVEKVDDIDFGSIPKSKGDITRIENYESMKECVGIIREIVKQYNQDTEPLDQIENAMYNIEQRERLFSRCYVMNIEMGIITYNTMVLAVVRAVSLMIATSIEFIKSPSDETFIMSLDKTAYKKTSDSLLFNSLRKFNIACKKGDIDKSLEGLLKNAGKQNFSGAAFAGGVLAGAGVIAFLITLTKVLIPLLQDLVYIFYASRQNTSDYFAIQADLLQANTAQIIYRNDINEATKKKIIQKQTAIAKKFRDISNRYAIDMTTSEKNAKELAKSEKRKYSVDTTSELPSDALF
jgi:hypothetical protein